MFHDFIYFIPFKRIRRLYESADRASRPIVNGLRNASILLLLIESFIFLFFTFMIIYWPGGYLHVFISALNFFRFIEVLTISYLAAFLFDNFKNDLRHPFWRHIKLLDLRYCFERNAVSG